MAIENAFTPCSNKCTWRSARRLSGWRYGWIFSAKLQVRWMFSRKLRRSYRLDGFLRGIYGSGGVYNHRKFRVHPRRNGTWNARSPLRPAAGREFQSLSPRSILTFFLYLFPSSCSFSCWYDRFKFKYLYTVKQEGHRVSFPVLEADLWILKAPLQPRRVLLGRVRLGDNDYFGIHLHH